MKSTKKLNNKASIIVLSISLLLLLSSVPVSAEIGDFKDQAIISDDIRTENNPLGRFLSIIPFAVAFKTADNVYTDIFGLGEPVSVHIDLTTWNLACSNYEIIAEVYKDNANTPIRVLKTGSLGSFAGNVYKVVDVFITPNEAGTYNIGAYAHCTDKNIGDIDGNGIKGQGEKVSNAHSGSFQAVSSAQGCSPLNQYIGDKTCRSLTSEGEDLYQLFCKSDGSVESRKVADCSSIQVCSSATANPSCKSADINGDGQCTGDENSNTAPNDCKVKIPIIGGLLGGSKDINEDKFIDNNLQDQCGSLDKVSRLKGTEFKLFGFFTIKGTNGDYVCAPDPVKYGVIFALIGLGAVFLLTRGGRRLIKRRFK